MQALRDFHWEFSAGKNTGGEKYKTLIAEKELKMKMLLVAVTPGTNCSMGC